MDPEENAIRERILQDVRPWGKFRRYTHNEECTVKVLTVDPKQMLSKQSHEHRDELWVILDEGLQVELDDEVLEPKPGDEIVILRRVKHRLASRGAQGRVLEISFGHADEDDIVRFEDMYGRSQT
ncbi:mannose-6-phosphate isomerase [candidate division TA06 bacterium DG_24]|uniref:Mannose-6-phosphate isomerase n=3 Tax=Bacteria division TA06 TaxID=1156500 RepID=A0A0S8JJ74_UNCT6|nr:MAG: mannose-6-phosphate isomerase [candidate division TA06 bacterium DG_24]KPK68589.1 MAG: mannose-6-phosphate isomerase [candidate division TA06 bacterium SM23_40]KPL09767.1 MAG: mannose-6-phosphate isomerase [candidate division TA06 bacterium SM1_40]